MSDVWASAIRATAFVRKEAVEILRQPRLLLTLVMGPFLVLLLFGVGLRDTDPPLTTVFVAPDDTELAEEVSEFASTQSQRLDVEGVTRDEQAALRRLRRGEVQLVVVFPSEVEERVRSGQQSEITLYHSEMDPLEGQAIQLFMDTAVAQINQQVLSSVLEERQEDSEEIHERVLALQDSVAGARGATARSGDGVSGRSSDLEDDLAVVEEALADFNAVPAEVMVAPFAGEAAHVDGSAVDLGVFYAPAVVIVLLQHLLVTLVGLSVVNETELGTPELYRVAPLRTGELIVGKYLAHMLIAGLVATALVAALILGLDVPMNGSWLTLAAILVAVLFASAGLGFVVAGISRNDGQAVQYTMLLLLVTIFFSGFILSLERFFPTTRWVGFLVPATYGVQLLRDEMLRGTLTQPLFLVVLLLFGALLALAGAFAVRVRLRPH